MENIFLHLLNMSITAAILAVVVMALRLVFHRAPRWIHCLLWALVAVRLLCPFSIESDLSLMPSTPAVTVPERVEISTPVITPSIPSDTPSVSPIVPDTPVTNPDVGGTVTTPATPVVPDSSVAAPGDSVDPWQVALAVATQAWLLGMLAMAVYAVVTTLRLRRQVREAAHIEGNLWQCDHIRTPFILGVFRPRIYLPSDLNGAARDSVIAHEQAHLRRGDHFWKPLGFLLLTVYWFNPVLWVAYVLLCRDIEAACDERVVRDMTAPDRKAYSEALLACSAPRRLISACPLAFGETSVKSRIKSVLSYKKPTVWILVAALLVSAVAGVCLLTDRPVAEQEPDDPPAVTDEEDPATAPVGETHVVGGCGLLRDGWVKEVFGDSVEGSLPIKAFYTYDELDAFLTKYAEDDFYLKREDFSAFDADWFAENALLMIYLEYPPTSSALPKVASYVYSEDGTDLSVRLHVYVPSFSDTAVGAWRLFSGIKKSDLEGVDTLTAILEAEIPNDHYVAAIEVTEHPDKAVEKWRQWLPSNEGWALSYMVEDWEEADRWGDSQSVNRAFTFDTAFNFSGHTHYFSTDSDALLRDDGALLWLTEEEGAFLRWIAVYYAQDNEDIWYVNFSHPVSYYEYNYAATPTVLDDPTLRTILTQDGWEKNGTSSRGCIAQFSLGGKVYFLTADGRYLRYTDTDYLDMTLALTEDEQAYMASILHRSVWADEAWMVGKVTGHAAEQDYVVMKLTDSSKYTSDIADGVEIHVSMRYMAGELPAVGSTIRVSYDGYIGSQDVDGYFHPLVYAHYLTVTSNPNGSTTTTPPTNTTTTTPTVSPVSKTATVIFTRTSKNNLTERQREKLFGTSSVLAIESFDALASYKTYSLGLSEQEYDAAFFQEYALLLTAYETPSGSYRPTAAVYTYSADGSTLSVGLDEYQPEGLVTDDIGEWMILSVIRRADMEGVTQFTSYVRAKRPDYSISLLTNPSATPQYATEKWSKAISVYEGSPLRNMIASAMTDEYVGLWDYPSDVLFDVKLVLKGSTYYYDLDKNILIAGNGEWSNSMSLTYCYRGMPTESVNLIRWCLARCSEDNEDLWFVASSHPTTEFTYSPYSYKYYSSPVYSRIALLNTAEMREIARRTNWVANKERGRFYDAQYTLGGALYYVDFEHKEIVNETQTQVSPLTDAEMAYLRSVMNVDGWAQRTEISGYVVTSRPDKGYITLQVDSKYADEISGTITVSLLYWTGETPAVGSHIAVKYDDYKDVDPLETTIWAWSIAKT